MLFKKTVYASLISLVFASNILGQCTFEVKNIGSDFTKERLESIVFVNDSTGYILSELPSLFKTTDKGNTWQNLNLDFGSPFRIAYEMKSNDSQDSLFIAGSELFIFDTNTGKLTVIDVPRVLLNFFISKTGTWFIQTNHVEILSSEDKGVTWTLIENLEGLWDMVFFDNEIGYAVTRTELFKTIDGGKTWGFLYEKEPSSSRLIVLDEEILIFNYSSIERTKDNGLSWSKTAYPDYLRSPKKVQFETDNIGYMLSFNQNDDFLIHFSKTTDGGATWTSVSDFDNGFNQWGSDFYLLNNKAIIVGRFGLVVEINLEDLSHQTSNGSFSPLLSSIEIDDSGGIYAVGYGGHFLNIDKEKNEILIDTINSELAFIDLEILNADTSLLLSRNVLYMSIDQMKSWDTLIYQTSQFSGLSVVTSGFLATTSDTLFYSSNYEEISKFSPLTNYSENLSMSVPIILNDSTWMTGIYGDFCSVLKTTNSGITWTISTNITELSYSDISEFDFVSDSIGYITGSYDVFHKTTDAGTTWNKMHNDLSNVVDDIDFIDENIGIISSGSFAKMTYDGGSTWYEVVETDQIEDVKMVNESEAILVGRGGDIIYAYGTPLTPIILGFDKEYCLGSELNISIDTENKVIYEWSLSGKLKSNTGNLSLGLNETGQFEVLLKRRNQCMINDSLKSNFEVIDKPATPSISFKNDTLFSDSPYESIWFVNGSKMDREALNYFIPEQIGTYQTESSNLCGSEISEKYNRFGAVILSIDNLSESILTIFPNPSSQYVNISNMNNLSHSSVFIKRVQMVSLTGHVLKDESFTTQNSVQINVSDVSNGTYIVKIESSQGIDSQILKIDNAL